MTPTNTTYLPNDLELQFSRKSLANLPLAITVESRFASEKAMYRPEEPNRNWKAILKYRKQEEDKINNVGRLILSKTSPS